MPVATLAAVIRPPRPWQHPTRAKGLPKMRMASIEGTTMFGGFERIAVERDEDFAGIGHLHGRGVGITIASYDGLPQTLRRDDELLARLS